MPKNIVMGSMIILITSVLYRSFNEKKMRIDYSLYY